MRMSGIMILCEMLQSRGLYSLLCHIFGRCLYPYFGVGYEDLNWQYYYYKIIILERRLHSGYLYT